MEHCLYNCSKEYIDSIDSNLFNQISNSIKTLSKHETQAEINNEILLDLASKGW